VEILNPVKQISYREIAEYTYENEEQRNEHVKFMTMHGWNVSSRQMRLKDGSHIMTATDDDYEWYGEFYRSRD
jgi:hypothetical protein